MRVLPSVALLLLGCWSPTAEYVPWDASPSERLDAASAPDASTLDASVAADAAPDAALPTDASRQTDASAPDASGRDAAVVHADDAGLIPKLPLLEESLCRTPPMPEPACPSPGGCVLLVSSQGQVEVLATMQALQAAQAWVVHATDDEVLLQVRRSSASPGPERLVRVEVATRSRTDLDSQPPSQNPSYSAPSTSPGYGTWMVRATGATSRRYDLMLSVGGAALVGAMPSIPVPTTRGVAEGTDYYVGHDGEVASYYPAGGGALLKLGSGESVQDLAVESGVVWALVVRAGTSEIRRVTRQGAVDTVARAEERLGSLAVVDGVVWALGGQGLLEVRPGQTPRWRYRGELFPQHSGTLAPESLVARGGRLYLGQICHFDADAPEYGTVEIDPRAGTARWLEHDPAFPFVGAPVARQSWEQPPIFVGGRLLRVVP